MFSFCPNLISLTITLNLLEEVMRRSCLRVPMRSLQEEGATLLEESNLYFTKKEEVALHGN